MITRLQTHTTQPALPPPLKWAGGKRWLVPRLGELWSPRSDHLVVETDLVHDKEVYYQYRDRFNRLIRGGRSASQEAAELFYYFNRTGYNGLCRFNKKGEFNVPFGRYQRINYRTDFSAYASLLGGWQFTCQDFEELDLGPRDFVYADPPYDVEFTAFSPGGFGWDEQVRLACWLAAHPGPVVASNQATGRILGLYRQLGFKIELLHAPRRISCNGDRSPAQEMLATKGL
jgi:DNA adenine methylase